MTAQARIRRLVRFWPWLLLAIAVWLVFSELHRPWAVLELWRSWAEIGILALVLTPIILTGGIDLSVGSLIALCGVVLGILWHDFHWPIQAAAAAGVLVGLAGGMFNATLVLLGVAPLVTTLATMALFAGLAMALSGGNRVSGLPESFCSVGQGAWLGIPSQLWLLGLAALVAAVVVHHTRWGRYLFALGDNRTAAKFAALPISRLEWSLYAASGLVAGCVALVYTARGGAAIPIAGRGIELQAIACVVVGGTRITGGAGGIGRTLLGIAVMSHVDIGLQLFGARTLTIPWLGIAWQLNANARLVIVGLLVVAAAAWNERRYSK